MKKINLNLIAVLFVMTAMAVFTSCDKEDDTTPEVVTTFTKSGKTITIKDNLNGKGVGNYKMYADTTYVLDGLVFVNEGQTLTIEAGTMIQGKPGEKESASALIVARGGKIIAEGTATKPIVFTALNDTYTGDGSKYDLKDNAQWGGLIILGKAKTNNTADKRIEGIVSTEERGFYGGSDNSDNSGVLKYVSVRHGGSNIGDDNELNGISLGAVGSGTVIEYIEVVSNKDDGIEFFGGVAQVKHALVAYVGDDCFDYDEGFSGKGQFWVGLQGAGAGDRCAEQDGGDGDDETAKPYAMPTIYNATYVGRAEGDLMIFRDNAAGTYANSIFANVPKGIRIEYRNDKDNSYKQLVDGNITIKNNIFQSVADGEVASLLFVKEETDKGPVPTDAATVAATHFTDNNNTVAAVGIVGDGDVPAVLVPTSGANSGAEATDVWFNKVSYQGAFEPNGTNWAKGWTLSQK